MGGPLHHSFLWSLELEGHPDEMPGRHRHLAAVRPGERSGLEVGQADPDSRGLAF